MNLGWAAALTTEPLNVLCFHSSSFQGVNLIWKKKRHLNPSMFGIQQVDRVRGGGRWLGGVGVQRRGGVAGNVGLPWVTQRDGESWWGSSRGARGTAGQKLCQSSLEVPHEQWIDDGVYGAITVTQPGDGIKKLQWDTLAHCLDKDRGNFAIKE